MDTSQNYFSQIEHFFDYLGRDFVKSLNLSVEKSNFPFLCSKHFADLIKKSKTPLALLNEILPRHEETLEVEGFVDDPVGDLNASLGKSIIQKYKNRALIMTTAACGVRCRFCFRRNFPFVKDENLVENVGHFLRAHPDVWEVIFSGGDPFLLQVKKFENLIFEVAKHSTVKVLRIHTRMPVMCPNVINNYLPALDFAVKKFNCVLVVHINHPDELDENSHFIFATLKKMGLTLLNQSVLLKGVNDSTTVLKKLSQKLFANGILPYYLHQLDHAKGVAHFEVPDEKALALLEEIRTELPGYLVPKLVREIAGEKSKTPIK